MKYVITGIAALMVASAFVWVKQDKPVKTNSDRAITEAKSSATPAPASTAPEQRTGVTVLGHIKDLPPWAVPYGGEFWEQREENSPPQIDDSQPGFNIAKIVERVSHGFSALSNSPAATAQGERFNVQLDGSGFVLLPKKAVGFTAPDRSLPLSEPANRMERLAAYVPDDSTRAVFKTASVHMDGRDVYDGATVPYQVVGNVAQALLNEQYGLVEHYSVGPSGVEVSWVVRDRPSSGGINVEARMEGVDYEGVENGVAYFTDAKGERRVQVGGDELVDANNQRIKVPADWSGNTMRIDVSADLLANVVFPVAIDPTIGPAFNVVTSLEPMTQMDQQVAWNGTNYLFVWKHYDTDGSNNYFGLIRGTIVNVSGTVLTPGGFTIRDSITSEGNIDTCFRPTVASDGKQFLVVWEDVRAHGSEIDHGDLYATRVNGTGTVETPDGAVLVANPFVPGGAFEPFVALARAYKPRAASNGTNYFVVWSQSIHQADCGGCIDIYGVLASSNGSPGSAFLVYNNNERYEGWANACSDGTNYMAVWGTTTDIFSHFFGARPVSSTGTLGTFFSYSTYGIGWSVPRVAYSKVSGNFLTAFNVWNSGSYILKSSRFTHNGSLVSPSEVVVTSSASGEYAIASDGTNYLVAYSGSGSYYGKRVSASSGSVLDSSAPLTSCTSRPWNLEALYGKEYLVSWTDGVWATEAEEDYTSNDVWATLVALTNQPLTCFPASISAAASQTGTATSVAYNNGKYLAVWSFANGANASDIKGVQLVGDGLPVQPSGFLIGTGTTGQRMPHVTPLTSTTDSIGYGFFVVWGQSGVVEDIYGSRVTESGSVLDSSGIAISTASGQQMAPCAASIGNTILVVWQDYRAGTVYHTYGARVGADGAVVDTSGISLNSNTGSQRAPRVATLGTDFMVVWSEANASGRDIYAGRVSTAGAVIDTTAVLVAGTGGSRDNPKMATSGSGGYVVVWDNYVAGNVYAARLSSTTSSVDTSPITVGSGSRPAVATLTGTQSLILWTSSGDILGKRLDTSTGSLLDSSPFPVDISAGTQQFVDVTSGSGRCLALYLGNSSIVTGRFILP